MNSRVGINGAKSIRGANGIRVSGLDRVNGCIINTPSNFHIADLSDCESRPPNFRLRRYPCRYSLTSLRPALAPRLLFNFAHIVADGQSKKATRCSGTRGSPHLNAGLTGLLNPT